MRSFRLPRLFKLLFILFLLLALGRLAARAEPAADLAAAMAKLRAGEVSVALATAGPPGSVGRDLIEWQRLRAGVAGFAAYRDFLARRPDWPGLPYLMKQGEAAIGAGDPPAEVVAWFATEPPQTGAGAMAAIDAYLARGEAGDAEALAVLAWRSLSLSPTVEADLLQRFPKTLARAPYRPAWTCCCGAALPPRPSG